MTVVSPGFGDALAGTYRTGAVPAVLSYLADFKMERLAQASCPGETWEFVDTPRGTRYLSKKKTQLLVYGAEWTRLVRTHGTLNGRQLAEVYPPHLLFDALRNLTPLLCPMAVVAALPYKYALKESPDNRGATRARTMIKKSFSELGYTAVTVWNVTGKTAGFPDAEHRCFVMAWRAKKCPILSDVDRYDGTYPHTAADFVPGSTSEQRAVFEKDPYVRFAKAAYGVSDWTAYKHGSLLRKFFVTGRLVDFVESLPNPVKHAEAWEAYQNAKAFLENRTAVDFSPKFVKQLDEMTRLRGHDRIVNPKTNDAFLSYYDVCRMGGASHATAQTLSDRRDEAFHAGFDPFRQIGVNCWQMAVGAALSAFGDDVKQYDSDFVFYTRDRKGRYLV